MARKSAVKGRRGEVELADILKQNGFDNVRTGRALSFGQEADVIGLDGIHIEVKRCQQLRISEWMKQASADADKFHDGLATIFHRKNREPWLVTMSLVDWLKLYKASKR